MESQEGGDRREVFSEEGGQASKKRRRSKSEKASLLVDTICDNRLKAEEHMDLYETIDFDAISRCQF